MTKKQAIENAMPLVNAVRESVFPYVHLDKDCLAEIGKIECRNKIDGIAERLAHEKIEEELSKANG